ncbi:hypothetical protein L249_3284 [Ophiocordyceps polyrhachis-furcata BCC 54312]|uniref:Kelch repeat protein n=1 Tax=Ophiocordyceps polyrhachis-furcata BCC 54312 TaxID=1330021 RepID=A0A367LMZ4_9HYPO|nr:hypothetical protein L249_3284 [Ophiocordyceps polyrhachis-furcata BCC 54312]
MALLCASPLLRGGKTIFFLSFSSCSLPSLPRRSPLMARRLLHALAALSLCGLVSGTLGDVCYIVSAKTALLNNDRLYFMGGKYSIVSLGGHTVSPTPSLYSLLVGNQFPVERPIPQSLLENTTIKHRSASLARTGASAEDGLVLWNTGDTLYAFGSGRRRSSHVAAYSVKTRTWKDVRVAGGAFNFGRRTNAQYVSVPGSDLHFVYGGTSPYMGGMIRFDSKSLSWTNETLGRGSYGTQVPGLEGGVMAYIPAGKEGMLISFGGRNATAAVGSDSDWHIIYVYDIASHTWWAQRATGKPPSSGRGNFCTSVVAAPDNGAFHITTYGGWSQRNGRAYEDLHILSIPSFTWIDATALSDRSNAEQQVNSTIGRDKLGGSCQTLNGRQMIVLGGEIRSGALPLTEGSCSDDFEPVRVLDLSTYEWQWELPDSKDSYQVPPIIYQKIGGGPSGGATVTAPKRGFADATLSSLLQLRVPTTGAGGSTSRHPSTGWGADSSGKSPGAGAIAGAVAGGVGGLAAVAGLTWFLMRNKRRKRSEGEEEDGSVLKEEAEVEERRAIPEMESVDMASPGGSLVSPLSTMASPKPSEVDGREVYELPI